MDIAAPDEFASPARRARVFDLSAQGLSPREIQDVIGSPPEPPPIDAETVGERVGETIAEATTPATSANISVGSASISIGSANIDNDGDNGTDANTPAIFPVPAGANNELFHFAQTDAIIQRASRQAAFGQRRPQYFPDANQLRNSRDFAREVASGVQEGLGTQATRNGGLSRELNDGVGSDNQPVTLQFQFDDGTVRELTGQIRGLQQQDRSAI